VSAGDELGQIEDLFGKDDADEFGPEESDVDLELEQMLREGGIGGSKSRDRDNNNNNNLEDIIFAELGEQDNLDED